MQMNDKNSTSIPTNRHSSYSTKDSGSNNIFIHLNIDGVALGLLIIVVRTQKFINISFDSDICIEKLQNLLIHHSIVLRIHLRK